MRQILVSVFSMVIPLIVIKYCSKELWGSFVSLLLFSLLALQIINWGNKEYLLRQFSFAPGAIVPAFSKNLLTRLPLVLLFSIIGVFFFPIHFGFWIFLWLIGRFFNHAVESLIVYEKKFKASVYIEIVSFAFWVISLFLMKNTADLYSILIFYSLYQFIKGILYVFEFRKFICFTGIQVDYSYYKSALGFFLLSVFGFFTSKSDVYVIEYFSDENTTANYQVLNSLLVFIMSTSVFIYTPFIKNIYRNNEAVVRKIRMLISLSGLFIVPTALIAVKYIVQFYLSLQLSWSEYLLCFLYVFPSFVYGIRIIELFRKKQEKKVIVYLMICAIGNTLVSALLLLSGYGIAGALSGGVFSQLLALCLFTNPITAIFKLNQSQTQPKTQSPS